MTRLALLKSRFSGFFADRRGTLSVETMLVLPILLWALVAMVVFFEAFRSRNHAQRAAVTVADAISRHTEEFTHQYIEGMNDVFEVLSESRRPTRLRVSSLRWSSEDNDYVLHWSYGTRGLPPLPPNIVALLRSGRYEQVVAHFGDEQGFSFSSGAAAAPARNMLDRLPPLPPGETLLLVESFMLYSPFANVGLMNMRFDMMVPTRPRFSPWVNLEGSDPPYQIDAVVELTPPHVCGGNAATILSSAPNTMEGFRSHINARTVFTFPVTGRNNQHIWGTDIYTDDAYVATAAVHAGAAMRNQTSDVYVQMIPGISSYPATSRNGVTSRSWGSWAWAYQFVRCDLSSRTWVRI